MSDSNPEGSDRRRERQLLDDLGRVARAKRARGESLRSSYQPDPERSKAILDALLGPEEDDEEPTREVASPDAGDSMPRISAPRISPPPEGTVSERRWLGHLATAAVTAVATAAAVLLFLRPSAPHTEPHPAGASAGPTAGAPPDPPDGEAPAFATWRIVGGGPRPEHQGDATPSPRGLPLCSERDLRLVLAVSPDAEVDRSQRLFLSVLLTSVEGNRHQVFFDVEDDDRVTWAPNGRALILAGPLRSLVPLTPGSWVLEPRIGPTTDCGLGTVDPRCTLLEARLVDVDGDACREDG